MRIYKNILGVFVFCALVLCACDLQPRIASIPDNIGMFIEDRYPALLADPETQPEIYNSAATDYGVYASPELYGSSSMEDYVLYASADDYVLVPEPQETLVNVETKEQDVETDYLIVPLYGGNTVVDEIEEASEPKQTKEGIITVVKGDTVYSLARKNNMSMSEFVQINNLQEPYTLSIGQKLTTQRAITEKNIPNVISVEKVQEIKSEKLAVKEIKEPLDCDVKIRYAAKPAPCTIAPIDSKTIKVIMKQPAKSVTPGQSAVFYIDDIVVGGGKII